LVRLVNEDDDRFFGLKLIGSLTAITLIPPAVVALGLSFIVPVDPWVALVGVLACWLIDWRLLFGRLNTSGRAQFSAGALGVVGAFVAGRLLGTALACAAIIAATVVSFWAISRLEDQKEAADDAAAAADYKRRADARHERDA
jgi:hypothetical protein